MCVFNDFIAQIAPCLDLKMGFLEKKFLYLCVFIERLF